uniref:Uncharacterized protein n=1 Tax=Oryza meridionalis TaxID=40149 RepID=A0A0E0C2Q3_9ORYZ
MTETAVRVAHLRKLEGAPVGSAKPCRGVCGPARWARKRRRASCGPDLVGGGAKAEGGAKPMLPIPLATVGDLQGCVRTATARRRRQGHIEQTHGQARMAMPLLDETNTAVRFPGRIRAPSPETHN